MQIIKHKTETYDVLNVMFDFCKFDEAFRKARQKYHHNKSISCFNCGRRFQEGDTVNVFQLKLGGNQLCCGSCAQDYKSQTKGDTTDA